MGIPSTISMAIFNSNMPSNHAITNCAWSQSSFSGWVCQNIGTPKWLFHRDNGDEASPFRPKMFVLIANMLTIGHTSFSDKPRYHGSHIIIYLLVPPNLYHHVPSSAEACSKNSRGNNKHVGSLPASMRKRERRRAPRTRTGALLWNMWFLTTW